jgi:hypothetical protein
MSERLRWLAVAGALAQAFALFPSAALADGASRGSDEVAAGADVAEGAASAGSAPDDSHEDSHEVAGSEETPRNETSGIALAVGLGYEYSGLGAQALYYIRTPGAPVFITPHAGVGSLGIIGFAAGVSAALGFRHRLIADLSYAMYGVKELSLHGTLADERIVYGVNAGIGYEYMANSGFLIRALVGGSYPLDAYIDDDERVVFFTLGFGLGWKLS